MPSVEYHQTDLITETVTREGTDPETGEPTTFEVEEARNPFEVRLIRWLEENDGYHMNGFVTVTPFGQDLAAQTDPFEWLSDRYQTANDVNGQVVTEWLRGVGAVQAGKLDKILSFGNVDPVAATVTANKTWCLEFEIVLSGPTTFDIEWLTVDFDPNRGGG